MSTTTPNLGLFKYNTTTDTAIPFSIDNALNANWDIIDQRCGALRNIGEIISSTIPLTDAGLHLLDGSLIQGGGVYSAFVNYMIGLKTNYPDLFCSEATWQEAVTNYGVCGKFVHDITNNTIRLPKITRIIEGTTDVSALGDLVEAGLPNIKGSLTGFTGACVEYGGGTATECFYGTGTAQMNQNAGASGKGIGLDASRSSSIYGNSTTVQPQTIKVLYYIVVATSTKTSIQVDIDEIATDLNGKCDKADLQECSVIVESYVNGTSWCRIYSDGWCEQGGRITNSSASGTPITYLKPMKDTNYSMVCSFNGNSSGDNNYNYHCINLTTNGALLIVALGNSVTSNGIVVHWQACGYIEV